MKYLDNALQCFGPIFLNCVFFGTELELFFWKSCFFSLQIYWQALRGVSHVECWALLDLLTKARIVPENTLGMGYERIIHMVLLKGRSWTVLCLCKWKGFWDGQLTTDWQVNLNLLGWQSRWKGHLIQNFFQGRNLLFLSHDHSLLWACHLLQWLFQALWE